MRWTKHSTILYPLSNVKVKPHGVPCDRISPDPDVCGGSISSDFREEPWRGMWSGV